jgi:ATP-dependent DNA helicase RecG
LIESKKKLPIDDEAIKKLRKDYLIEGRKPNFYVSSKIAKVTGDKVDYIKNRALDDDYYEKLIIDYLHEFEKATRKEINELLYSKLSENFDEEKKTNKVANLLTRLRRAGKIHNTASKKAPVWKINAE